MPTSPHYWSIRAVHLLDPSHAVFFELDGLRRLLGHLPPSGVFALWSNDLWLECMSRAMLETGIVDRHHDALMPAFSGMAEMMRNT